MSRPHHAPGTLRPAGVIDTVLGHAALAAAGVRAALRPHRFFVYAAHDPAIFAKAAGAAALHGGLLYSTMAVWRLKLGPALDAALASWAAAARPGWLGGRTHLHAVRSALPLLFTAAWAAPAYAACVLLSVRLYADVAALALGVRDVARAPPAGVARRAAAAAAAAAAKADDAPASPPGPAARAAAAAATAAAVAAGARPPRRARSASVTRPPPRPAAAAAGALFRSALMAALLAQASAARALLPGRLAGAVAGFLTALLYGWYTHDYAWAAAGLALPERLANLEAAWPFYAGFGLVTCLPAIAPGLPALEGGALASALYPVFVVLAVDAGPRAGAAAAARVAADAAARRGVALPPGALPILRPAIAVAARGAVGLIPAALAVLGWAARAERRRHAQQRGGRAKVA